MGSLSFTNIHGFSFLLPLFPPKTLMFENTSKETCLNYPLQIKVCSVNYLSKAGIIQSKLLWRKKLNSDLKINSEKAFFKDETKKINGNILPNDTVLPRFPLSQYKLRGTSVLVLWRQKSWAKTWRSKFCNVVELWLWEDLLELLYQGNYTSLTHWADTSKWSNLIDFSDSNFDLAEARTHQERRDLGTFPQKDKARSILHRMLFQPPETAQGKSGNWA